MYVPVRIFRQDLFRTFLSFLLAPKIGQMTPAVSWPAGQGRDKTTEEAVNEEDDVLDPSRKYVSKSDGLLLVQQHHISSQCRSSIAEFEK